MKRLPLLTPAVVLPLLAAAPAEAALGIPPDRLPWLLGFIAVALLTPALQALCFLRQRRRARQPARSGRERRP
jgi:hypothetical protein